MALIYKFEELDNSKVKEVGGKNASLGEMFTELSPKGINIPDGYATSADAYRKFIRENEIEGDLKDILSLLDAGDSEQLEKAGKKCRKLIMDASITDEIKDAILEGYRALRKREK